METKNSNLKSEEKTTFINHFVNAVYAVLLGYGFSDSMREITDGKPESVGILFSIVSVIFVIIVICTYWWDWFKNIGYKVQPNLREFTIDMAILITLVWLFFVFYDPIIFSFIFFILSLLNLLWVYNYQRSKFEDLKLASWKKYLKDNKNILQHISNRKKGVFLYGSCLLITFLLKYPVDNDVILFNQKKIPEFFVGNWFELIVVISTFITNRKVYYKDRPL